MAKHGETLGLHLLNLSKTFLGGVNEVTQKDAGYFVCAILNGKIYLMAMAMTRERKIISCSITF